MNSALPRRFQAAKWLLLSLVFVWLVGCVGPSAKKKARDPFLDRSFSCGEEKPSGATSARLNPPRG